MLRIGAGLTAEDLARECEGEGLPGLVRGTIAKIESGQRRIRAAEVACVARAFGLNAADLLDPVGPAVILCYAQQDDGVGRDVSVWLSGRGFRVLTRDWAEPAAYFMRGLADVIEETQAFVALISSAFLTSSDCMALLDLASRYHQRAYRSGYIQVLQLAGTVDLDAPRFSAYQPIDLRPVSGRDREKALSTLGSRILRRSAGPEAGSSALGSVEGWRGFLDRRDELDKVFNGLDSPYGPISGLS